MRESIRWRALLAGGALAALAGPAAAAPEANEAGKKLFTQTAVPACAVCHTLAHAGSSGEIGPNLDELKPDASRVEKAVRNGIGAMPAFPLLTEEQVKAIAQYVAAASAAGK